LHKVANQLGGGRGVGGIKRQKSAKEIRPGDARNAGNSVFTGREKKTWKRESRNR